MSEHTLLAQRVSVLERAVLDLDPEGLTLGYLRELFEIAVLGLMNDGGPLKLTPSLRIQRNIEESGTERTGT